MYLGQSFLIVLMHRARVHHTYSRGRGGIDERTDNESGDIMFRLAAAAYAAVVVASLAGSGVEYRPDAVTIRREQVLGFPIMGEEVFSRSNLGGIHVHALRRGPAKDAQANRAQDNQQW